MQIIAYLMVCSWWVVRRWVCVYGYVFSFMLCSVFHQTAIYVPPFSAQSECSTFSFPAFPEMDSWDPNPPKRQRCIPNSRLQKSCAKGMYVRYVQYKNQKFVDRRESVVANVSIGELLCEQRPAEKDSKGWEITTQKVNIPFISSAARTKRDLQHGSVSHVLDLLAPVRLGCLLCKR